MAFKPPQTSFYCIWTVHLAIITTNAGPIDAFEQARGTGRYDCMPQSISSLQSYALQYGCLHRVVYWVPRWRVQSRHSHSREGSNMAGAGYPYGHLASILIHNPPWLTGLVTAGAWALSGLLRSGRMDHGLPMEPRCNGGFRGVLHPRSRRQRQPVHVSRPLLGDLLPCAPPR